MQNTIHVRWSSRIFFLIAAAVASQALLLAGFAAIQIERRSWERTIESLKLDLRRARDLQAFFLDMEQGSSGAVASVKRAVIESWHAKAQSWKPSVEAFAAYGLYRPFREAYDNYQEDLQAATEFLDRTQGLQDRTSLLEALTLLKTSEQVVRGHFKPLIEEISQKLESTDRSGRERLTVSLTALVFLGLFSIIGILILGGLWLNKWRRQSENLNSILRQLATGKSPQGVFEDRRGELGSMASLAVEAARQLVDLRQTMIRWDRLKAMGQLAGGIAHELNNPLTGVLGQAELLRERLPEGDPARSHVLKIIAAAERCRRIVRNLLDFSRQRDAEFAQVDIETVLQSVKDLIGSELVKFGIEWIEEIEPGLPSFWASPVDLTEALLNLIVNAKDAMPRGGRLIVRAREAGGTAVSLTGQCLVLEVEDSGEGIAPEALSRLFEAFYTTKELGKGTGLGLSTVYGIVKNHGGQVKASSPGPGRGAKFTVYLPLTNVPVGVAG
ncbi:MAG: hypothetical protein HY547_10500 [Elusimicrobia bacterium]|nr:hypothetical protein [Elusimicrobiota bacterium]